MKDFLLCPFRAIAEMWNEGASGKWLALMMSFVFCFVVAVFVIVPIRLFSDFVIEGTVKCGEVMDKWYEPERQQWTGKFYVHIPPQYHVVIRGKNAFGVVHDRDVHAYPKDFESSVIGAIDCWN